MATSPHLQPLERNESAVCPPGPLSFRLPAADASAAEARRHVRRQLPQWGACADTCDTAQLVISELVTNVLRHTGSTAVRCELRPIGGLVRIAVAGEGPGPRHTPRAADMDDESGRGLLLVCTLATRWGVRPWDGGRGHVVWADLRLDGAGG
ncbi:ATP-binding protein [Streptomyces avicenniae]|uniref:ATP-binding protein n=1 Tax=Streptomyces avicenniae TaxID=500153 RepID=UPI00167DCC07|nr:ATP-binding protein [Streptomyces avicenniae]